MVLPIQIPIVIKHVASVKGEFWRVLTCSSCQQPYALLLELEATGDSHQVLFVGGADAAALARRKAVENLLKKNQNIILPVPCPMCGSYSSEMVRVLKDDAGINASQIAGAAILFLSLLPLAFGLGAIQITMTAIIALAGLVALIRGLNQARHFDPNAGDPEPRKELGRKQSIWGETLAELLKTGQVHEGVPVERAPPNQLQT